jgi:outer membrane protein
MRNTWLIWNIVLTLALGYLLFRQFGGSHKKDDAHTASNQTLKEGEGQFRMAYFEMDSIEANFEMVKGIKDELARLESDNSREMDDMVKGYQQRFMYFQNLARAGKLSQSQSDSANEEMKRMEDQIKQRRDQMDQDYAEKKARKESEVKTRIEAFLKEYNKSHNFSYIVSYEQGLFYYKDTVYNITGDVIRGLNEMYKINAKR